MTIIDPFWEWLGKQSRKSVFSEPGAGSLFWNRGSKPSGGMQSGSGHRDTRIKPGMRRGRGTRSKKDTFLGQPVEGGYTKADDYVFGTDQPDRFKGV